MDSLSSQGAFVDKVPVLNLRGGIPGACRLKKCPEILLEATRSVLQGDCDVDDIFSYGYEGGDDSFRQNLANFLTEEYGGDRVDKECLMMTAGATHGLHVALTLLIPATSPVFIVDPSYFLGHCLVQDDMPHPAVSVPSDSEGPLMDELEQLVQTHLKQCMNQSGSGQCEDQTRTDKKYPYQAAVYLVPTFNNPRGGSYSTDRCKALVTLARKYNLMLLADDVYNLIYFTDLDRVPPRLLTYDLPSDPDYGQGHVISNCSFSKILAPAVRLGWIEGPKHIVSSMSSSMIALSGGAFNHYVGKLVTELLRSGKQKELLVWLRESYKNAMTSLCQVLDQNLPEDCLSYIKPQGGFFVWLPLHPDVDGMELLEYCEKTYKISFLPGVRTSPSQGYKNCVRLSTANTDQETLVKAGNSFCRGYKEFLAMKGIH